MTGRAVGIAGSPKKGPAWKNYRESRGHVPAAADGHAPGRSMEGSSRVADRVGKRGRGRVRRLRCRSLAPARAVGGQEEAAMTLSPEDETLFRRRFRGPHCDAHLAHARRLACEYAQLHAAGMPDWVHAGVAALHFRHCYFNDVGEKHTGK